MKKRFKLYVWRLIDWAMPQVVQARINDIVEQTSVKTVQAYLDREGLSHCHHCPSRKSLRYLNPKSQKGERLLACPKHYNAYERAFQMEKTKS